MRKEALSCALHLKWDMVVAAALCCLCVFARSSSADKDSEVTYPGIYRFREAREGHGP